MFATEKLSIPGQNIFMVCCTSCMWACYVLDTQSHLPDLLEASNEHQRECWGKKRPTAVESESLAASA